MFNSVILFLRIYTKTHVVGLNPIILATWEEDLGLRSSPAKKIENPCQPTAGHCGAHLLSQLWQKAQTGELRSGWPG
jgi:hypothetical protein